MINALKAQRQALWDDLKKLISNDSYSRKAEQEIRAKIVVLQRELAKQEIGLTIEELALKEKRGALTEKQKQMLAINREKLSLIK